MVRKGEKAKFESVCEICKRPIRGTNESILKINKALHKKKHEITD